MIIPKLDSRDLGTAYNDIINPLIENFTNEAFAFSVQKHDGSVMKGKLEPNSHIQVPNLRVGDSIKFWNNSHMAHQEFTHPKNSKYIMAHHRDRRNILFKHRGYHPIIVNRWVREPERVERVERVVVVEQPKSNSDNKLFIMIFIIIVLLAVGLAASLMLISKREFSGSGPIEDIPESIFI